MDATLAQSLRENAQWQFHKGPSYPGTIPTNKKPSASRVALFTLVQKEFEAAPLRQCWSTAMFCFAGTDADADMVLLFIVRGQLC